MDSDSEAESKLISLISQLLFLKKRDFFSKKKKKRDSESDSESDSDTDYDSKFILATTQIISLARSMDLDSQPKPKTEFMSLTTQIITLFNSMDLESPPKPLSELISFITELVKPVNLDSRWVWDYLVETLNLEPEPESELVSLIVQILSLVTSMHAKWGKLISLSPQVKVSLKEGKFCVKKEVSLSSNNKWDCLPHDWETFTLKREDATHFRCGGCNGEKHQNFEQAPPEAKPPLHPKHNLHLVLLDRRSTTRECYCCDETLKRVFYNCSACDFAMNIACVEKPPVFSIDHPKWHEHPLALFSNQASLTCDICALAHSRNAFYICPPCGFVGHQSCMSLPGVIRISRHPHRISFTLSFKKGDWLCGVCRRKIDNDYGGYSCIKDGCSYAAHSRCATQRNVWDGKDLEEVPEEIEEEVLEPYVTISNGVIQHFSHLQHQLRLDENIHRDYDEKKLCQACTTPIYFGNFYYCVQCDDFILHEKCANLSRKMHHPIHPHKLTLVGGYNGVVEHATLCFACPWWCTAGFFYKCSEEGCRFKLHVDCATIDEPLVHGSHIHPLFLTSKPGEQRICKVCKDLYQYNAETFNCIECDFALCFGCAILPQKVRYKHDKHTLTLSYGEETSSMVYWCEVCEGRVNPKERFYVCDEYCCVTLHITCLLGKDLYMMPGSSFYYAYEMCVVMFNQMSRPVCFKCGKRCPHKIVPRFDDTLYCSTFCIPATNRTER